MFRFIGGCFLWFFVMIVREVWVKSILSRSRVFDYSLNPYIGCMHGCRYCYARFMKRFCGHREGWGEFVDVKVNAVELLMHEVGVKRVGLVWISGVCDPYQPVEARYGLTRACLEVLLGRGWPVFIQTKSNLVLRDLDLLMRFRDGVEVALTITTGDEGVRRIFEPNAPSIGRRLEALEALNSHGIRTCVMIAPILPGAEMVVDMVEGLADKVLLDKLNYHYADWVYREYGLEYARREDFFASKKRELREMLEKKGIPYKFLY